ncbi:MAG: imelysin family protein, partial [Rhodospirillales bacterium]
MAKPASKDVLNTYADIAQAMFDDTLSTATELKTAVDTLVAKPSDATLKAARDAWKAARAPYQQTEALRFGNALVDEWEGKVNAWPLDEGLIDYVAPAYGTSSPENPLYSFNVVANDRVPLGTQDLNATTIDRVKALLDISSSNYDAVLTTMVAAASRRIENYIDRPLEQTARTQEYP